MTRGRAAAGVLAVLLVTACGGDPATPRSGTSVEELTGDVSGDVDVDTARVGGRISLRATVTRVLSPGAFEISAADAATDRPVLVLNREDDLSEGQDVQVVGVLDVLDDEVARAYGLGAASDLPEHDDRRVIVADEVDTDLPEDGR